VGDLHGATGLSAHAVARAVARLVATGEIETVGAGYQLRRATPWAALQAAVAATPKPKPSRDHLRERLMDVVASKEDRSTIRRLLSNLSEPIAQRDAILLLARLESK
jgi:DNA-binding MarR family transcriptional regulator